MQPNQRSRLWHLDAKKGRLIREFDHQGSYCKQLHFSPDDSRVIGSSKHGVVQWELATGEPVGAIEAHTPISKGQYQPVLTAEVPFAATVGESSSWFKQNTDFGYAVLESGVSVISPKLYLVGSKLQISPEGDALSYGNRLFKYAPRSGESEVDTGRSDGYAFYPQGRLAFAISGNELKLHSLLSGKVLGVYHLPRASYQGVTFSPKGDEVVFFGKGGVGVCTFSLDYFSFVNPARKQVTAKDYWSLMASDHELSAWGAALRMSERDDAVEWIASQLQPAEAMMAGAEAQLRDLLHEEEIEVRRTGARLLIGSGLHLTQDEEFLLRRRPYRCSLTGIKQWSDGQYDPEVKTPPLGKQLRSSLAIVALERNGGQEAIEVLRTLATGAEIHPQTQEAQRALARIGEKK